jgi:hypothetical protein
MCNAINCQHHYKLPIYCRIYTPAIGFIIYFHLYCFVGIGRRYHGAVSQLYEAIFIFLVFVTHNIDSWVIKSAIQKNILLNDKTDTVPINFQNISNYCFYKNKSNNSSVLSSSS